MPETGLTRDVADGVHLVTGAYVNCYLIEDETGVTLVDTGLPAMWPVLMGALAQLGRRPEDLTGVVVTHAHFDHLGCARRLQSELGLPVYAHLADHFLAAHPYRYAHERPRSLYPLRYPKAVAILTTMARAGALQVPGITGVAPLQPDSVLELPGRPRVVFTPGHTLGHCALHLPDRDAIVTGDALVTLDPYTGFEGPQLVARAATADTETARTSLATLAATNARVVLPGHGAPWFAGIAAAAGEAQRRPTR